MVSLSWACAWMIHYLQEIVQSSIPCVLIDLPLQEKGVGSVTTDNVRGAYNAIEYLIRKGHKHIGMINGHAQAHVSIKRLEGYRQALEHHQIPFREDWIARMAHFPRRVGLNRLSSFCPSTLK